MNAAITRSATRGSPRSVPAVSAPFHYLRPLLKNMELDADACAVRMLKLTKEPGAIERARVRMQEHGDAPTGAYYPTGNERAGNIVRKAEEN
jgi:hypothetical protein